MSKEFNTDTMTDEEMEYILNQIDNGTFESQNSGTSDDEDDFSDDSQNSDDDSENQSNSGINLEDTDESDEDGEDDETNNQDDGSGDDTSEDDSNSDAGNSQENADDTDGDNSDTSSKTDADATATGKIDPAEYERLKSFHDKIANAEFVANGKKVKAFTDPDKIIRSQQMAYGYSEKMRGFNEYRPFLKAMKEKGLIEDESKFNFAMSLIDGDKAAIKEHLKALKIDPVELEMDEATYQGKNYVVSKEALILEDTLALAKEIGVEDKLRDTVGKQWDEESFREFVEKPEVRADLLEHLQTGTFDIVQDKVKEMELLDQYGTFSRMKSTDKYREAIKQINAENARRQAQVPAQDNVSERNRLDAIMRQNSEKARLEAEYKANVQKKNLEADEARKRAASISKKKAVVTKTAKFDPLALDGDDLSNFVDGLISGKIK